MFSDNGAHPTKQSGIAATCTMRCIPSIVCVGTGDCLVPVLPSPALWEWFTYYWGMYFHYHRPLSHAVFLSSHHMPIPLQSPLLYFLCDVSHFRCPSYSLISDLTSFVSPHIHRSIPISAISNVFSSAFFNAHVSAPYISVCPTIVLYTFPFDLHVHSPVAQHHRHSLPVLPPALHSVCDFRIQFSILRQRRYKDLNVITLFTLSHCTWTSA